jgi:NADP-dependent 3-hydroxy acid dehydrogenase YdfG
MVERQKGFIVNIGSVAAKEAYTDGNVYCATKAAVDMLTKGMRLDLHKYGIRVAAVHPGHVETEFALVRFDGDEQKADIYGNFTPLMAVDVAETVYYIVNRPLHVNIQDVLMFGTQQASATVVDASGKKYKD